MSDQQELGFVVGDTGDKRRLFATGVENLDFATGPNTAHIWRTTETAVNLTVTIIDSATREIEIDFANWPVARDPDVYLLEVEFLGAGVQLTWPSKRDDLLPVILRAQAL